MNNYLKKNILVIIGVAIGVLGGYLYWHFIGCDTGTCPITSKPLNSMAYGGLLGGLIFSMFSGKKSKDKSEDK